MDFNPAATPAERIAAVQGLVDELNANDWPIVVGPWRSEVGFESLYFVPYVRALAGRVRDFDKRVVVVTRGGAGVLYRPFSVGPDLYTLRTPTQVRRENLYDHRVRQQGRTQKQVIETDWDRQAIADATEKGEIRGPVHTIHPSWMYWTLTPFWEEEAGYKHLAGLCDFAPIPKPALPADCPVPPKYVAVKFYGRATLPFPHHENNDLITRLVATIAAQVPVVVLAAGDEFDDHVDGMFTGRNITMLPKVAPERNLEVQAAVIANATAFVGTYGGMAQLALRLGVPSVSFYSQWGGTAHAHLSLSSILSKITRVPFVVGSLGDIALWRQLTSLPPNMVFQQPERKALVPA